MSPEQCMGGQLDQRADIYSLGIVMYEALTGEVPFFGKNYVETMSKQIGEPARPPSVMNPNVKIPEKLERVIMRALEKEPNKRYQRVEEMLEDLHKSVETPKKKAPAPTKQADFKETAKPRELPRSRELANPNQQPNFAPPLPVLMTDRPPRRRHRANGGHSSRVQTAMSTLRVRKRVAHKRICSLLSAVIQLR